jgi:hypothetical protein
MMNELIYPQSDEVLYSWLKQEKIDRGEQIDIEVEPGFQEYILLLNGGPT